MALNLRQKQTECIIRMLNLNQSLKSSGTANKDFYKILIYDRFCQNILSPLIHVKDLRKHGVTLYFLIDKYRKTVHDVPAVYFVQPTQSNIQRIIGDASEAPYDTFHLNFSSCNSHVQVHVKRSVVEIKDPVSNEADNSSHLVRPSKPLVRRSKLVLEDLAGSERVHKSGSEGHMLEEPYLKVHQWMIKKIMDS